MTKKLTALTCISINRQSLVFYAPELASVETIPLTSETIQDLDIVNESALERVIKNWIRQSQIVPKTIALYFLEETYFFQDITNPAATLQDPEVQAFVETVPFANVITKIFPIQGGARVTVINRDLLIPLITVLEHSGFTVLAASPAFAAGITQDNPFSLEVAKQSLTIPELITTYNFLDPEEIEKKVTPDESFLAVKFDRKLMLMLGVFFLLLMVLGGLLVYRMNNP